jgi:hypothetical protein
MKKFVSLGSAMMMGTVLAREKSKKVAIKPQLKQGVERICIQERTVPYTNPVTGATYPVLQCWNCEADGIDCEWEFANNHEWDGSDDGSPWTSIITDFIKGTSPSPVVKLQAPKRLKDDDFDDDNDPDDDGDDDYDDDDNDNDYNDDDIPDDNTPMTEFSYPDDGPEALKLKLVRREKYCRRSWL